jgi:hypothetical protein
LKVFKDFGMNTNAVINIAFLTKVIFPNDFVTHFAGGCYIPFLRLGLPSDLQPYPAEIT